MFRDATIYLNGHRRGHEPSGYTGHLYDVSDQVFINDDNVLAVRADSTGNEGWWYEGGGIYRHVWLTKTAPVFFPPCGIFISAELGPCNHTASIQIISAISNDLEHGVVGELLSTVSSPDGKLLAETRSPFSIGPGDEIQMTEILALEAPALWSPDDPALHRSRSVIVVNGEMVDEETVTFGVRSIRFDPDRGFFLNGKSLKILGTSNHEDHAGVGMAVPDRLFEFRISRMKEMGANAWRCAHNPPAPAFLDACDRLGMLVMDETRCMNSTLDGRRQLETMIRRDRNHPSVIIWSIGNEETVYEGNSNGREIARHMRRWIRRLDPTRPVTLAMSGSWGEPVSPILDVQGCNYNHGGYDDYHKRYPAHPMLSSENFSAGWSTRGEYENNEPLGLFSCYDKFPIRPDCTAEFLWKLVADRDFIAGTFPWTGFDYRGEACPNGWPCVSSNFGILDTCGFPKDIFNYYKSCWSKQTVLHVFPHWNWPGREGQRVPVWCYSNCDEIELFLNGISQGRKRMPPNGHLEWDVPYVPGTLHAVGYADGKMRAERIVETAGPATSLALIPETDPIQANGEDVAIVTAAILDANGRTVPLADNEIHFSIEGEASFLGVGNGNPTSHESDKEPRRRAFHGLCQILLRASDTPGAIVLKAISNGLRTATMQIHSVKAKPRFFIPAVDPKAHIDFTRTGTALAWVGKGEPAAAWNQCDFSESEWSGISLNGRLVLPSPVWIRVRFCVPAGFVTEGLELDLGAIHDYDDTWMNGIRMGSYNPSNTHPETAWQIRRRYLLPKGLINPGRENILAIHAWNRRPDPTASAIIPGPFKIRKVYL